MLGTEPDFDLRPPAAPCYKVALCGGRGFEYVLQVALPFGVSLVLIGTLMTVKMPEGISLEITELL